MDSNCRLCRECGAAITGRARQARYCSASCQKKMNRGIASLKRSASSPLKGKAVSCAVCKTEFSPARAAAAYCSSRCRYKASRARLLERHGGIEGFNKYQNERTLAHRRRDPVRWRAKNKAGVARYHSNHPNYRMWSNAKNRARHSGVPFAITRDDIVIPSHCPLLGVEIKVGAKKSSPSSPSLDRIVPHLGYVPGNVIVVSLRANTIKNDATADELFLIANNLKRILENK